jgi:N-acetylglucosamine-6-phosphate deacetylase
VQVRRGGGLVGYGIGEVSTLGEAFRAIVGSGTLSLTEVLRLFTSNPADILGLSDR